MKEVGTVTAWQRTGLRPWLWTIIVLAGVLVFASCSGTGPKSSGHSYEGGTYQGTELDGPAPDFRLTDQRGASVSLSDFQGQVVALAFLDPNCTDVCPLTAYHFRRSHQSLGEDASKAAFLAVNVNPRANSVAEIAEATRKWGIEDVPSWHFLTGSYEQLEEVWQAYNVDGGTPKRDHHEEVQHSPGVYLIDQEGSRSWYVSAFFEDASPLSDLLVEHIRTLLH